MDIFLLYLFTRLDPILDTLGGFCFAIEILSILLMISYCICTVEMTGRKKEEAEAFRNKLPIKSVVSIFILLVCIKTLVPSQKDLAVIVGGSLAIKAVQSETASKVMSIINKTLDDEFEKLTSKKKESK